MPQGPYRVLIDHGEECPPDVGPKHVYYRFKTGTVRDRHNPNVYFISANITTFITANDNYTV